MSNKTRRNKFKWLKRTLAALGVLVILLASALGIFMYKVTYGFPFYEDEMPEIELPSGKKRILLFQRQTALCTAMQ